MTASRAPDSPLDRGAALAQYRRRAPIYDLELAMFEPVRVAAIARLALRPGDAVLDVGCGTGLSLALLHAAVGERGHIIGIDQCPQMLDQARERVRHSGWRNVTLIEAPAEDAGIAASADAALFHFTHDILREPRALAHLAQCLRPGARIVASGLQWAQPWAWPVNLFVLGAALHSVSSLDGLVQPWSLLADYIDHPSVETMLGGGVYIASGAVRPRDDRPGTAARP